MNLALTRTSITYLRYIPSYIKIDMNSSWNHITFTELSLDSIESYITSIKENRTFLIVPIFSISNSSAMLNLSSPFLIDKNSNAGLITSFIVNRWNTSGFNTDKNINFILKTKRVWFEYK